MTPRFETGSPGDSDPKVRRCSVAALILGVREIRHFPKSGRRRSTALPSCSFRSMLLAAGLLCLLNGAGRLLAQPITAVQFSQNGVSINLQSQRGQPISTTVNTTIGSDGHAPTVDSSTGGSANLTASQFAGLLSFGSVTAPTNGALVLTIDPNLQGRISFPQRWRRACSCRWERIPRVFSLSCAGRWSERLISPSR